MRIGHSPEFTEDGTRPRALRGLKPLSESHIERNGIKPGTAAPQFTLQDTHGRSISLEQYRGRRLVLVFTDPHCGPCDEIAPDLVRAYERRAVATEIVAVGRGDFDENRRKAGEHGFKFPLVVQDRWKLSRKYGIFATPVAFLIGDDGRTMREAAIGVFQIRQLLREEFPGGIVEQLADTLQDISSVLSSPLPRRHAFRVAGRLLAGVALSTIGLRNAAAALQCRPSQQFCGGKCCGPGEKCCGGTLCCGPGQKCCDGRACCHANLECCNGKCCAPGEVCVNGRCQPRKISKAKPR
jgi:peroxiredoxin